MWIARIIATAIFPACVITSLWAQQKTAPAAPAPIPEQILSAKKVFIANVPGDLVSYPKDDPARPYNEFYAAMKEWGRFQAVTAPADADLIFEINITDRPIVNIKSQAGYRQPQFALTIVDPKTGVRLWWFAEIIHGANREETLAKNYTTAISNLVTDVKKLVQEPAH